MKVLKFGEVIWQCLSLLMDFFPFGLCMNQQVFMSQPSVLFHLKCQKFIEMVCQLYFTSLQAVTWNLAVIGCDALVLQLIHHI